MTKQQLENIRRMEDILNRSEKFLTEANELLEKWKNILPEMQQLETYYGSDQWHTDHKASNQNEIPQGTPHGVLSEDLIYNMLADQHYTAIAYIKLMAEILDRK